MVRGNYFGDQLFLSRRARTRLSMPDSRELLRLASLNTGDLSVRVDPEKGKIFFLGPREHVLDARDVAQDVLDEIDQETTVYFNAEPEDLSLLKSSISHIVRRCRIECDRMHHEVFVNFPEKDSPSSTVRIDGQPALVNAILSAYESGDWRGDTHATIDCPISSRTMYALMRSRVHQLSPLEEKAYPDVGVKYLTPDEIEGQHKIRFFGTRRACHDVVETLKERVGLMRRETFIITSPTPEDLRDLDLRREIEGVRVVVEELKGEERTAFTSDPVSSVWVLTAINKIDMRLAINMLKRPGVIAERWRTPAKGSTMSSYSGSDDGIAVSPIYESEAHEEAGSQA
ncbi:hypothetical protein DL93DRAFT_1502849 [Clavulina sp. PMI_390]|nr:hypothetical protein DL93DRAFT_1502849 [Clavulina sp. PMI_390]